MVTYMYNGTISIDNVLYVLPLYIIFFFCLGIKTVILDCDIWIVLQCIRNTNVHFYENYFTNDFIVYYI